MKTIEERLELIEDALGINQHTSLLNGSPVLKRIDGFLLYLEDVEERQKLVNAHIYDVLGIDRGSLYSAIAMQVSNEWYEFYKRLADNDAAEWNKQHNNE